MNSQHPYFQVNGHRERASLLRATAKFAALLLAALPLSGLATPQVKQETPAAPSDKAGPAAVQHVKLLLDKGNPAIEIETTSPVTPEINKSNEGMRVVIDLPNTNMSVADKVVPIRNRDLSEMRLNLVGSTPPRVHVEVDFRKPLGYTWNSAGNRLLVSFHDASEDIGKTDLPAPTASAAGETPLPVSLPAEPADLTYVVPAERIASGASITADSETTVLRVKRAGDIYVCPRTSVSVVHSKNGPDMLLALNDGGLETHLALKNSADEVVTPDFRILLRGPGIFHYAIRADSRGNTCVRTLPGNTAPAIIYELLGDGTYDVKSNDQLVFRNGKLKPADPAHPDSSDSADVLPVECGCPPPPRAVLLASSRSEPRIAVEDPTSDASVPARRPSPSPDQIPTLASGPAIPVSPNPAVETPDEPENLRDKPHVQVEASLTFTPNPARLAASHLPASSREVTSPVAVEPPAAPVPVPAEKHKSIFGRIKAFFSRGGS